MNRRDFFKLLGAAAVGEAVARKTYFLPPVSGWINPDFQGIPLKPVRVNGVDWYVGGSPDGSVFFRSKEGLFCLKNSYDLNGTKIIKISQDIDIEEARRRFVLESQAPHAWLMKG